MGLDDIRSQFVDGVYDHGFEHDLVRAVNDVLPKDWTRGEKRPQYILCMVREYVDRAGAGELPPIPSKDLHRDISSFVAQKYGVHQSTVNSSYLDFYEHKVDNVTDSANEDEPKPKKAIYFRKDLERIRERYYDYVLEE